MPVRYDERAYFFFSFFKIGRVGDDIVYPGGRFIGKVHTRVNHNDIFPDLYSSHILAYFFHSSQWNDADYASSRRRNAYVFRAILVFILSFPAKRTRSSSLSVSFCSPPATLCVALRAGPLAAPREETLSWGLGSLLNELKDNLVFFIIFVFYLVNILQIFS